MNNKENDFVSVPKNQLVWLICGAAAGQQPIDFRREHSALREHLGADTLKRIKEVADVLYEFAR